MADPPAEKDLGPLGYESNPVRFGIQCMLVILGILFVSGSILFSIGYDKAFIKHPLPAYGDWHYTSAVVEQSRLTPSPNKPGVGSCAAKFWFVISRSSSGLLEKPKRVASWGEVHASTTAKLCTAMETKKVHIYYDTKDPKNVMVPDVFEAEKLEYEDLHSFGASMFWTGVAFVAATFLPLIIWLAALVSQGFRHMKSASDNMSESGYGATSKTGDGDI